MAFQVEEILHYGGKVSLDWGQRWVEGIKDIRHTIQHRVVGAMEISMKFPNARILFVNRRVFGKSAAGLTHLSAPNTNPGGGDSCHCRKVGGGEK